jgi:phosphocarrier protein FPr
MEAAPKKSIIFAPVSGVIVPLAEVPDPTFAQKMVGDGIAIDPTNETLYSPCDGKIAQLHPSCHALTVASPDGIEILMHIGLDTVTLKGLGFKALVSKGDSVKRGEPLIVFDADYIAKNAASLLTMIVITNAGKSAVKLLASGMAEAGTTPMLDVSSQIDKNEPAPGGGIVKSMPIAVPNPNGLHARPAAVLVANAKRFSCSIKIGKDGREVNAKSVVGIMGLSIQPHEKVIITAEGTDAASAVETLTQLIQSGLGENLYAVPGERKVASPVSAPGGPMTPKTAAKGEDDPNIITGVPASPGLVTGALFQIRESSIEVNKSGQGVEAEKKALNSAVSAAMNELDEIIKSLRLSADTGKAAIFTAHKELLQDPELLDSTLLGIDQGQSAAYAWRETYTARADSLGRLNNELLAARAADIRDIGERVLLRITGAEKKDSGVPKNAILVARDLSPSDTAKLYKSGVAGLCITGGSATSHASILARAAGIPAVVGAQERVLGLPDGTPAILDGEKGFLETNPSDEKINLVREKQNELEASRREELSAARLPAITGDGVRVKVVGNISGASEANEIPDLGGEGVGLLRSEFLFLQRTEAPSEEEQKDAYAAIAKALGPERSLIVRTLDVGGDKPLAYMPLPEEINPFLGIRGIRLNMLETDIFTSQIRSILKIAPIAKLGIMFPMVASADEFKRARDIVLREKDALGIKEDVKIGIMVEVPSAAVMADLLAQEVDFFSIGTNDLTQYTLAMDRTHPRLAKIADALHPAVLRLIRFTTASAHKSGKWAGVCGGIASDTAAVPILLGLGVDELSVSVKAIPSIKAAVRRLDMERCKAMAEEALEMKTAGEVRAFLAARVKHAENDEKNSEKGAIAR